MSVESFQHSTQALINTIPGDIIPKIRYLLHSILEIAIAQEKVCNLEYDVIPKLFALEDNKLYVDFLDISKNDNSCRALYKSHVGENYDEFMFISMSFLNFIFNETGIKELDVSADINKKKIKIIKINNFVENEDDSGDIKLQATIH